MADEHLWPDGALAAQAARIGPALLELIDAETRWVHRRVERIELANAVQATRSIAADMTIPVALASDLTLYANPQPPPNAQVASRIILPLGILPKAPLEEFSLTPEDVQRLAAEQSKPLLVLALAPLANRCGADPDEVLFLLAIIVRSEVPAKGANAKLQRLLKTAEQDGQGESGARERLSILADTLCDHYVLLVAIDAEPGCATRVTYEHRQTVRAITGGFGDPPLTIINPLPYVSRRPRDDGPPHRIEVVAPDGLEIETASIVDLFEEPPQPVESRNAERGKGAYIQLKAPHGRTRPVKAGLNVEFGFPAGGIHHVAAIAGGASTVALWLAVLASFGLDEDLKGSSASALLAAPALVTSFALGFATTRVTSKPVNRLRLIALFIALLGVLGGLSVSLLGESSEHLNLRHGVLTGLAILSTLALFAAPAPAAIRPRASVPLSDTSSSSS